MFQQSFHGRVAKHLGVFQKAVEGLKQVRKDIADEVAQRNQTTQELIVQQRAHEIEIQNLMKHSDQIGDTITKLNVLLPTKGN